jgi:hypothetical protein
VLYLRHLLLKESKMTDGDVQVITPVWYIIATLTPAFLGFGFKMFAVWLLAKTAWIIFRDGFAASIAKKKIEQGLVMPAALREREEEKDAGWIARMHARINARG